MHRITKNLRLILSITITVLLSSVSGKATAEPRDYTKEKPLIYEDAWDLWPYSFLDDEGNPAGFNIDLVKALAKRLNIPLEITLKHSSDAYRDLKEGKSDLILGMHASFHDEYGKYGHSVICLFTNSIVTPKSQPLKVKTLSDLRNKRITVHKNSFSHNEMKNLGMTEEPIPVDDMKEAVFHISAQDSGAVLWNTMSLKWLINKYHLDELKLTPINMNHGEYRFISNDTVLLAKLDSAFMTMTLDESIQPIRNKWFYPEYKETGIPSYVWTILYHCVALVVIFTLLNFYFRFRERRSKNRFNNQNKRLQLYLTSGKISLWTYDIEATSFVTINSAGSDRQQNDTIGLPAYFLAEDFKRLATAINDIKEERKTTETLILRSHPNSPKEQVQYHKVNISVQHTRNGKPIKLLGVQRNITKEYMRTQQTKEQLLKYFTLFDSSMVDMAYFNKDGILLNMNEKACQTLGIKDKEALLRAGLHVNDIIPLSGLDISRRDVQWSSSISDLDELREQGKLNFIRKSGKLYYQSIIIPILDEDGEFDCFYCVGYDITEMVQTIQQEREQGKRIAEATQSIQAYIDNINYVLEESEVNIVKYFPDTKTIKITRNLHQPKQAFTQLQCLRLVDTKEWRRTLRILESMDEQKAGTISFQVKTKFKEPDGIDQYLTFDAVPVLYPNGQIKHYFGLCRNMSQIIETERQLQKETEKAQEAETIKNAFLKNMSHEIRTPLNAVIGFAELFDSEHTPEDEPVFVNEIKKNTNILLKLINDVLFLSRLDAKMVEIKPQPTDINMLVTSNCQLGCSKYLNPDVTINIECPKETLILDIDRENLGHVIQHIAGNAAHFTRQGTITAKYAFHAGHLLINIADTGIGIKKERLSRIFDRFVDEEGGERLGSGLGMHICKELVTQMGGNIDVESEPGKGTSVWVSIPCKAVESEEQPSITNDLFK